MDTVARVANVASPGCYLTSLDDASAFLHILLRLSAWPLFGFSHGGTDYCWCVLPFGFSLSPSCYHTFSEARVAFLRSNGIPALAYFDDSWVSNFQTSHGLAAREQWLAAGEATHVAMLVCFCAFSSCPPRNVTVGPLGSRNTSSWCATRTQSLSGFRRISWISCSSCCERS